MASGNRARETVVSTLFVDRTFELSLMKTCVAYTFATDDAEARGTR